MAKKTGMGGHGSESYDPATGKFVEDGRTNKYYYNPSERKKMSEHIPPKKIEEQSAATMTNPIDNLGDFAKAGSGTGSETSFRTKDSAGSEDSAESEAWDRIEGFFDIDNLSGLRRDIAENPDVYQDVADSLGVDLGELVDALVDELGR